MPLSIKHPEVDRLARELASRTGESLTDAVLNSLRERLTRGRRRRQPGRLAEELRRIGERRAALPVLDPRRDAEILGYEGHDAAL